MMRTASRNRERERSGFSRNSEKKVFPYGKSRHISVSFGLVRFMLQAG